MSYPSIRPEILPFAAQSIATILRVMGWTLDVHTTPASQPATNANVKQKLVEASDLLNSQPSAAFVEKGRLMFKRRGTTTASVYLYLGDLKRVDQNRTPDSNDESKENWQ